MKWWWLSFADADKPKGQQFLGVSLVQAPDYQASIQRAWELGCNPGGSVLGGPIAGEPPPHMRNRALTKDEIETYGESTTKPRIVN